LADVVSGAPLNAIAKQLGVSEHSVKKYIKTVRDRHPARELAGDESGRFVEGYEAMKECGLLIRQELARMKAHGEDVRPLLTTLSVHADRHSRFLTRQQAAPVVEVNADVFATSTWAALLGASHQQAMADASAVDCAQIEPVQASEGQPDVRVPAEVTGTQALIPGLDC
jgi:hypothetical protein